jgi:hypothetical protein
MPYAPSVNDRSGEILGNAGTNAAQIRAQGSVAAAQSVSDAITNISNMYMKKQEQNKQDTAKLESSMATGQAMMNLSQQYGTEGATFRQSLSDALNQAGKNPDKIAGATAAHLTYFDNMMAKDKTKAQYEALGNAYAGRAEATAAAKAAQPPKMNAETIRSMVSEAKTQGFSDDAIKAKLQSQYGDWAVNSVYPSKNQTIWMGQ